MEYPQNCEDECTLLGKMLISINAVNASLEVLTHQDFFNLDNQQIFKAIEDLYAENMEIEPLSVASKVKESGGSVDAAFIYGLSQFATNAASYHFIKSIKTHSTYRKFMKLMQEYLPLAAEKEFSPDELFGKFTKSLDQIFFGHNPVSEVRLSEAYKMDFMESGMTFLKWVEDQIRKHQSGVNTLTGLSTGYSRLDKCLNGLNKGHYIIIGARPGQGKTTFILNLIRNLLFQDRIVGFFTLEMSKYQVIQKLTCIMAGVDSRKTEDGTLTPDEFSRIYGNADLLSTKKMVMEDQSKIKISQMAARTRRWIQSEKIDILFIDYLTEVSPDLKFTNRQEAIQNVSQGIRAIAKDLNIPVVCICQLNRDSEKEKRRPRKSDLRESGQIEADAHSILLLHRPETDDASNRPGVLELLVVKNRFGPAPEKIDFNFNGATGEIIELKKVEEEINDIKRKEFDL